MTACSSFQEMLLEADPDVLRGEGDSPLAAHVRDCPRCARAATLFLRGADILGETLANNTATPSDEVIDSIIRRARAESMPTSAVARARTAWFLRPSARWVTLAAAASVAALLFVGGPRRPRIPVTPTQIAMALPLVDASDESNVAVIQTDNPDITVLWFF